MMKTIIIPLKGNMFLFVMFKISLRPKFFYKTIPFNRLFIHLKKSPLFFFLSLSLGFLSLSLLLLQPGFLCLQGSSGGTNFNQSLMDVGHVGPPEPFCCRNNT